MLSNQEIYDRISNLLENVPAKVDKYSDVVRWCTKADVLVEFVQVESEEERIEEGIIDINRGINRGQLETIKEGITEIRTCLIRCLYRLELSGKVHSTSGFIPAGNEYDALIAVTKVFSHAEKEILLVDPYLDHTAFRDFLSYAPDEVKIEILCSTKNIEEKIGSPLRRWQSQNPERDIEVKHQNASMLHDRLIIIDRSSVFLVSQSLNGIAKRSHAYIVKADAELSKFKIIAYANLWETGSSFKP